MKKTILIPAAVIILSFALCISLLQSHTGQTAKLEVLCQSSINAAEEHFANYASEGKEADYLAGISEFRAYMTMRQALAKDAADTEYLWCNTLYGYMTIKPDAVKAHCTDLAAALSPFADDYNHPNGFQRIHALNNLLHAE